MNVPSVGTEKNPQIKITANSSRKQIVENERRWRKQSLLTIIFKSLDDLVCTFMDLPLSPHIDPTYVLSGNFAPVDELPPTACEVVEGTLPSCLDGAYVRNGPNPQFIPRGPYHLFDGDGMLHSIRISGGKAVFCSRYVKTYKYTVEGDMGYPFFASPFSSFNGRFASIARCVLVVARALTGYFNPIINGFGTANTSLALFAGNLFALCESDLPYAIKVTSDGEIITLCRHDFYTNDPSLRMTAHPKIDTDTGEVFAFRCNIISPFLTFFRINSAGRKGPDVPIFSIKRASCVHDFALTENFIVFQDIQIEVRPMEIMKGRSPVVFDRDKMPRLGILPRYAEDETQLLWIDAPGLNMLHLVNAWEEDCGKTIVILAPNVLSVEHGFESINLFHLILERITVDVKAKKVVRQPLSTKNLEFGVINPAYAGKKNKYVYATIIDQMPKAAGVVKLDLSLLMVDCSDCTVASRLYGPSCYGGEHYFVPREPDNPAAEEDDGYLVTYVHNENTEDSWFLVMNAKSPTLDIVAKVKLPGRVPYGFHGLFVRESDLN
ncbi:hypothetical protein Pfo_030885 [Paulownia fortunei]|nr:hypothetical protein Pfo_025183 [Paulownia fortunei]KAI3472930.1 hypothetical protein Pfo_030885 [Paulownia fortunei]